MLQHITTCGGTIGVAIRGGSTTAQHISVQAQHVATQHSTLQRTTPCCSSLVSKTIEARAATLAIAPLLRLVRIITTRGADNHHT